MLEHHTILYAQFLFTLAMPNFWHNTDTLKIWVGLLAIYTVQRKFGTMGNCIYSVLKNGGHSENNLVNLFYLVKRYTPPPPPPPGPQKSFCPNYLVASLRLDIE